jgi:hypothetical protein
VDSIIELELENRFDRSAEPIRQLYHITIRVPEKRALDDVDRAFVQHLGKAAPDMAQVAGFLDDPRCGGIVSDADALATYVRGVLIKDQDRATGVTLPPAEARELYGDALGRLQSFGRLLPNVICALIRFSMNDFSWSEHPTGVSRLDRTMTLLAPLVGLAAGRHSHLHDRVPGQIEGTCDGIDRRADGASLRPRRRGDVIGRRPLVRGA